MSTFKLGPAGLLQLIKKQPESTLPLIGPLMLLLVEVDEEAGELARGFDILFGEDVALLSEGPVRRAPSRTKIAPLPTPRKIRKGGPPEEMTAKVLARRLKSASYVAAIVNKRGKKLDDPLVMVGRAETSDVILLHPSVSTKHAVLDSDPDGGYFLKDAGSTNGTGINGRRLTKGKFEDVYPGDDISFGQVGATLCRFETLWRAVLEVK